MTVKDHLLSQLLAAEGAFISGGELAATLGVSRNAVWKAIKALEKEGYRIESIIGKGYRLASSDVLSTEEIRRFLKTPAVSLTVHDCVTSTNRLAKTCAEDGGPEKTVIVASSQTEGRGRLGRHFYSPDRTGLYMSIVLRPTIPAAQALSVTTAAAVAVCRAIEQVSDRTARIKWVNDVFCDDKKVCGILTEASVDTETGGLAYAVLGIGINVRDPHGGFPSDIADIAASVFGSEDGQRARLAAAVLDEFFGLYEHLADGRFIEEYRARSLLVGRRIVVKAPSGDATATALGVDEQCRLRVRFDDGSEQTLSSGDVSITL